MRNKQVCQLFIHRGKVLIWLIRFTLQPGLFCTDLCSYTTVYLIFVHTLYKNTQREFTALCVYFGKQLLCFHDISCKQSVEGGRKFNHLPSKFSVDQRAVLFCEILTHLGNIYLEMELDFFHLNSHKLGLHLKIPNFLSG